MVVKKTSPDPVSLRTTVIATLDKSQTTSFVNQPAANNVHRDVIVADNVPLTPGTSAEEAAPGAGNRIHEFTISPYASDPVAIDCGPGLITYPVPKHLLRSPKWLTTDGGGTICLPGVSAATGHTLVHYLYTGTYQALEAKGEATAPPAHLKFEQALSTFVLASTYELQTLEILAKERIKMYGNRMTLVEILDTARKEFSKLAWSWFHEYLQARAEEQFDLDHTFFTSTAFVESIGEGTLYRFMMSHLLQIFSGKLTHTLQSRKGHDLGNKTPDTVLEKIEGTPVNTYSCHCRYPTGMFGGEAIGGDGAGGHPPVDGGAAGGDRGSRGDCDGSGKKGKKKSGKDLQEEERLEKEEEEILAKEEEDCLAKEAQEEADREEKREEDAAASAAADLSWSEPAAPPNDDWSSFVATENTRKKKIGKKEEVSDRRYMIEILRG
ncbi:hypothetical protein HBI56_185590 [Parastagonospora nodorum]|nr:hypothetical protein HBH51_099790 [Parastagonospora nodorum]KAH4020687.1 hypothetical protein HBI09_178640 [Parastagonospora nodorum]KAH4064438.1 hypothetical protein HBH50_179280 [Parastagonospora nodorum]KAH4084141.1 hypothetical protein HBH48_165220 [Parastagonospora nodorum]KAH4116857.1 hypothetical protein HBH47_163600 [Parastagonospora nodorum]